MCGRGVIEVLRASVVLDGIIYRVDHNDEGGEKLHERVSGDERVVLAPEIEAHRHEYQIKNNLTHNESKHHGRQGPNSEKAVRDYEGDCDDNGVREHCLPQIQISRPQVLSR